MRAFDPVSFYNQTLFARAMPSCSSKRGGAFHQPKPDVDDAVLLHFCSTFKLDLMDCKGYENISRNQAACGESLAANFSMLRQLLFISPAAELPSRKTKNAICQVCVYCLFACLLVSLFVCLFICLFLFVFLFACARFSPSNQISTRQSTTTASVLVFVLTGSQ